MEWSTELSNSGNGRMAGRTEWLNGGNGGNGGRTEWSNGGNGRMAEMATYVLFTVHTDDTDTNTDTDDTLIFYSIEMNGEIDAFIIKMFCQIQNGRTVPKVSDLHAGQTACRTI